MGMLHAWSGINFDVAWGIARFVFGNGFAGINNEAIVRGLHYGQEKQEDKVKRETKRF